MSFVIERKVIPVDKSKDSLGVESFVSVRFGGAIEPRDLDEDPSYKGSLFWADAGDLIYSKIDCRNGAIGIVPNEFTRVAVTSEFPVYRVRREVVVPEFIRRVFQTRHFMDYINGMVSGASGRKRVQPVELESVSIPVPSKAIQEAIVKQWKVTEQSISAARAVLDESVRELDEWLLTKTDISLFANPWLALDWNAITRWDVKTARAAAFRLSNPNFVPFGYYAEEATALAKPQLELDKDWPIYGVNNTEGVFFSQFQKGAEFNTGYKRIKKDWFFHNPTRSAVGSLGIVPEVPDDAITSPEYQVWRLRDLGEESLLPQFVATLIRTSWFIKLIQFHRVGAVKQRLYVENLLEIPVPRFPRDLQKRIAAARISALEKLAAAKKRSEIVKEEVEEMILGTRPVEV